MEFVLFSILILVVIAAMVANKFSDSGNPYPFAKRTTMFSQVETAFLRLLEGAVGEQYRIVSRVKLMDVIDFKAGMSDKAKRAAIAKAKNKTLDFVLLDKDTLNIVAAVDLVNNANRDGYKAQRDWFVSGALEASGVPHIRIKVKAGYKAVEVRNAIMFKLGKHSMMKPQPSKPRRSSSKPAVLSPSQAKVSNSTQLAQVS